MGASTDPNMPKKPMTGYFTFCAEHRDRIKEEMRLTGGKVAPKLAEMWKQLSEEKQQEYKDNYNTAMEKYREDLAAYKETDSYKKWVAKSEEADDDGDEFVPDSDEEIDQDEYVIEEIEDDEEEEEIEQSEEEEEGTDEGLDWDELEKQTRKEEAAERRRKREERKRRREEEGEYSGAYMQTYNYSVPQEDQWHISQEVEGKFGIKEEDIPYPPPHLMAAAVPPGFPLQKRPRLD